MPSSFDHPHDKQTANDNERDRRQYVVRRAANKPETVCQNEYGPESHPLRLVRKPHFHSSRPLMRFEIAKANVGFNVFEKIFGIFFSFKVSQDDKATYVCQLYSDRISRISEIHIVV